MNVGLLSVRTDRKDGTAATENAHNYKKHLKIPVSD